MHETESPAKANAVQQAQVWAQEARTQRATVLSILRYFGLPEQDYNALTLIQEKDAEHRAAMLEALDALDAAGNGLRWYRDRHPEDVDGSDHEADEKIAAAIAGLTEALSAPGVGASDGKVDCTQSPMGEGGGVEGK